MLDCTDAECRDWREYAKTNLQGASLDPMVRDYRANPMDGMTEMVEKDKADIDACDIVLINFVKPSVGTSMEVLYGWERGKKIVLVAPPASNCQPVARLSQSSPFPAIEEAVDFINSLE